MNHPIALLTDFGLEDHYVGSLKAVILSINPGAHIFDITHDIRPQNIREGAFVLSAVYPVLPKGTIVVTVVDPGVGSDRQAIAVETSRGFLLGPNNGLFSMALQNEKYEARALTNDKFFRKPVSATFHGRDIFSPSAAHLSKKDIFNTFGPPIRKIHELNLSKVKVSGDTVRGEIDYIDRFGNAMTNISISHIGKKTKNKVRVTVKNKSIPVKPFFGAGAKGNLFAIWNSNDLLELAVKEDSAEKLFQLKIGDQVFVK